MELHALTQVARSYALLLEVTEWNGSQLVSFPVLRHEEELPYFFELDTALK